MKVLILAAGMGNRLEELTDDIPKAMIEVGGRRLIDRVLNFADNPKVDEIAVVGGFKFEVLSSHLKARPEIKLYENTRFEDGNIFTLMAALNFLDDDFLMMNVDHIYPKKLFDHIINNSKGLSAICDFDRELAEDDMKVKLNGNRQLKKISKQLKEFDAGYIGMTYCSKDMVDEYKKAVNETAEIYGNSACVEFVLGHLAANDTPINICDTSGFRWLEVDTQEDLKIAEKKLSEDNENEY